MRRAFTLTELLVVITIVAVLAAIVMPALASAKDAGKATVCLSNLKQMGLATMLYLDANDDTLPLDQHSGKASSWITTLTAFSKTALLWRCPSDPSQNWDLPLPGSKKVRLTSFGTSFYTTPADPYEPSSANGYTRLSLIANPSATIYVAELSKNNVQEHFHPAYWYRGHDDGIFLDPQAELARIWHADAANYAFLDGHAKRSKFTATFSGDGTVDLYDPTR